MINSINRNTAVVLISQMRKKIETWGAANSNMGGMAVEHLNSTLIKLWSNPNEKEAIKEKIPNGDILIETPVGRPVKWTIEKQRGPGMNMSNNYDLYFAGNHVGVDRVGEVIDFGAQFGVVKKGGAWYALGSERLQGRPAAVKYLRENPDEEEKLYNAILKRVNEFV